MSINGIEGRKYGAYTTLDFGINYASEDMREKIKEFTAGKGVDVIYDAVGGAYAEPALRSSAWRGRFLVVGFAAGEIPKIPLNLTLLKGCSIVGVFWGDFARREPKQFAESIAQLGAWYREGKLKPHVSQTFPLEKAVDALKLIAQVLFAVPVSSIVLDLPVWRFSWLYPLCFY